MYNQEEKLCLKWNEFQENALSSFGTLREDREFSDVTLACEGGQQVEAHKVILASSSPFFLNLLRRNKHPHPLIYLRGLKSEDLVAMIDFLYCGEAVVYQKNLDSFLAVTEEFQLKGLMGSGAEKDKVEVNIEPQPRKKAPKSSQAKKSTQPEGILSAILDKVACGFPPEETVTDFSPAADLQALDDKIRSMMAKSEKRASDNRKGRICTECGKEGPWNVIRDHIEANHITGVSHTCDICGKESRSRNGLKQHKSLRHPTNY